MKNPNIKWFHYPAAPVAWLFLLLADVLTAWGESIQYGIPFRRHYGFYRQATYTWWKQRWH